MQDDPYISEEVLGTGPSAKVYRGHDVAGSTLVRIKALLTSNDVTCPVDRDCVRAIVPPLLALQHPQVCRLIAIDEHHDDIALVSELSPGDPLPVLLRHRGLSALDIRALATQLLQALRAGEALGLRHGDVKPSNIIIADHQAAGCSLQLQDWGLADCRHDQPQETFAFRAPERLSGAPASPQSDLFSAGATLSMMMLGRPPVQGDTAEQLFHAWASFDPMVLRHTRPDVDAPFHDWLAWMLRFDPAHRPTTAAHAQDMLAAGAMISAYIPPMVPMYQVPVMQTWHPQQAPPAEAKPTGPAAAKPRPPTSALTKGKADTKPAPKAKRRIPFGIIFSLTSLLVIFGFVGWLMNEWGPEWPDHLRKIVVETMGGSVDKDLSAAKEQVASGPFKGQFVRIEIPGSATLNLAEVEVFSAAINIARDGKASAKDNAWGGKPELANDGNTNGDWNGKSIYHSKDNTDTPWWEVDFGSEHIIDAVKVWNRTDGNYAQRLSNYSVIVFDSKRREVWRTDGQPVPEPSQRHEVKK